MNSASTYPQRTRPLLKRALPYFIAAAILINTNLGLVLVDAVMILVNSIGVATGLNPNYGYFVLGKIRVYGNIILIIGLLILTLRNFQEKNNVIN